MTWLAKNQLASQEGLCSMEWSEWVSLCGLFATDWPAQRDEVQNFTAVLPLREELSNTGFLIRTHFHGVHACTMDVNIEHVFIFGLSQESYWTDRLSPHSTSNYVSRSSHIHSPTFLNFNIGVSLHPFRRH